MEDEELCVLLFLIKGIALSPGKLVKLSIKPKTSMDISLFNEEDDLMPVP